MTIRWFRNKNSVQFNTRAQAEARAQAKSSEQKRGKLRRFLLEMLEPRQLMAVGPQLIGIQPNNSDLLENGETLVQSPRELRFRFDDAQVIDQATINGIRITRSGGDGTFGLASVQSDFGSNGKVNIQLTATELGKSYNVVVSQSLVLGLGAAPNVSVTGGLLSIVLNGNPSSPTTADQLVSALNTSASGVSAKINGGLGSTPIGTNAVSGYSPLRLNSVNDVVVVPGAVLVGQSPDENEVTVRFAENLTDDNYRVEIFGFDDPGLGIVGLRNVSKTGGLGDFFKPSDPRTRQDTIDFRLDLGPLVLAVVPQPVSRVNGQLQQLRDTIVVHFDSDKLLVENGADGNPTARSVENPAFYKLILTADTVRSTDDVTVSPEKVTYNAATNTATLRFNRDINDLGGTGVGPATFRLRIGTRETTAMQPVRQEAAATVISDLNTAGVVKLRFTSKQIGELGSGVQVAFTNTGNAGPSVTTAGRVVNVNIGGLAVTAQEVFDAIRVSPAAAALVSVDLEPGSNPAAIVGNRTLSYSPLTLLGLGSSFDTATELGAIGSAFTTQTNLILSSSIDPEKFVLDLPGAVDDPGQRNLASNLVGGFEDHVNPTFGADATDGITTIYYNFRSTYAFTNSGNPLTNAITADQKARTREVLSLWAKYIGVQFVETADLGMTFASGTVSSLRAVGGTQFQDESAQGFGVRIDKTFQNSLVVLSATNNWGTEYGASYTRTMAAAVGMALGLQHAGDLPETTLMRLDPTFLAGSGPLTDINDIQLTANDERYEPVLPGNQDVLHGRYLHRPDGSDIDLYRFEVSLEAGRSGLLTVETYAERLTNSSALNTNLQLYRQTQARASTYLGNVALELQFEAVRSGAQGNQLQIFFTQTSRGDASKPSVLTFPNAISIDLNATPGAESTVQDIIDAIRSSPAASSLVRVSLTKGLGLENTRVGNNVLTQNPVVLTGGKIELISQNDDYFSQDSLMKRSLSSGVYYIGVSASGNDNYNASIPGTGFGGQSQGNYELRLEFRTAVEGSDTIQDLAGANGSSIGLDGDGDGVPGGTYNFWFQTRPLDRTLSFNAGGSSAIEGRTVTVTGANGIVQTFEFSSDLNVSPGRIRIQYSNASTPAQMASALATAINSRTQLGVVATPTGANLRLTGERTIVVDPLLNLIDVNGRTIFVDKSAGPNADGSLARPFNNISSSLVPNAFGATHPGDIVRIVGNGGTDANLATVGDNFAYEIGLGLLPGSVLSDGATMDVPRGVTTMIDAGAVFKLRNARIGVGSSNLNIDRSVGTLQVLGSPLLLDAAGNSVPNTSGGRAEGRVFFTSWLDESIGLDNYQPTTSPAAGNWGGISLRRDVDSSAGRQDLEDQGIFLNYISHADIRYGGGTVNVESVSQPVNPIEFVGSRPTIVNNIVTRSSGAAISAAPSSFEETNFNEPRFQINGSFVSDYNRVGPDIHRNTLLNNSINGLFIKVDAQGLNVPGRFDDIDIVHVLTDTLLVSGAVGGAILDSTSPPAALISLGPNVGGNLIPGIYNYKITFVDRNGYESVPSNASMSINLQGAQQTAITLAGLPSASGDFVRRKLYRSQGDGSGPYDLVTTLDRSTSSYLDTGEFAGGSLRRDRADVSGVTLTSIAVGTLPAGIYSYRIVMVDAGGREGLASNPTSDFVLSADGSIQLTNLPRTLAGYISRRIYRSSNGGTSPYQLVGELLDSNNSNTLVFTDSGITTSNFLSPESLGIKRPRLSGSLVIDPGSVIKLEAARIELAFGASLIAEGTDGLPIVFTSRLDDSVGAGGTFDTNNNRASSSPAAKNWGGIYAAPTSKLSLDYARFAYAGGVTPLESTFRAFNTIEINQADARIAHTLFESNGDGFGGQGPGTRLGRLSNERATIFVRGAQPTIVDNVFRGNAGSAITIDVNSMTDEILPDGGRQSGDADRNPNYAVNRGPLLRGNRFVNNGLNGLKIRGDTLTTASVWDDTDIVHVVYDEIYTENVQHEGGLKLQSSATESLVVKFDGYGSNFNRNLGAGLTANGQLTSATDRVGGSLHLVGQPGFPVILTSLKDDTVGAGLKPDGKPQADTNNDGIGSIPQSADWRGILLDQYSNDRNVALVPETEDFAAAAPGPNGQAATAQVLGTLAANSNSGDETRRLGFVVDGTLSQSEDVDVYSFTGVSGAELWLDIDYTQNNLDLVLELLNANGQLLARSDNSTAEASNPSLIFVSNLIDRSAVNPLATRTVGTKLTSGNVVKEDGTTNLLDPGLRIRLPGATGNASSYFVRIRSSSTNADASGAGLTSGAYQLQIRLREAQEWAGSTINYADIRYATNAVHLRGLPGESPLIGEAGEDENVRNGSTYANNGVATGNGISSNFFGLANVDQQIGNRPQYVGNLLSTAKGAISIAGNLSSNRDVDFYALEITQKDIVGSLAGGNASVVFDMDYADGLNRPDTSLNIFREEVSPLFGTQYRLIYSSDSSNIADDQGRPLSITDVADLSRGSAGKGDAYIGPIALPEGNYLVGVSSAAYQPRTRVINPSTVKPISSIRRIVDEAFIQGVTSAVAPVVQNFLPANRNIGPSGQLVSLRSFDLGGYSAADLPALYLDYSFPGGGNFEVFVRESNGAEFAVASSTDPSLLQLQPGGNTLKIPLNSVLARPAAGGVTTRSFAGQDGLSLVFRSTRSTTRIDNVIIGFAERGEAVGVGDEPILLSNDFIAFPLDIVSTRQFSLVTYNQFLDRPQVAFDYEVFNGQLDVWVVDDLFGTQQWLGTTVAQNRPANVTLLTAGSPQSAVLDISAFSGRSQLRVEFRARNDNPSRTRISNAVIQLADGSRVGAGEPNSTYTSVAVSSSVVTTGNYQLEIRLGDEFFESQSFGAPTLTQSFDTNDRLAEQLTLIAPAGSTLTDGDLFTLSDGGRTLTFEFTSDGTVGLSNVPVPFSATDARFVVARAIRDAINSSGVQSQFQGNIRAATSSGFENGTVGRDTKINLHGTAYFKTVKATNSAGSVQVIFHQGKSDQNARREQSQVIIQNSFLRESRDYGIWSEAPARLQDPRDQIDIFTRQLMQEKPNFVGTQAVRNLLQPNNGVQGGLVPGIVVQNNLLEEGGLGGIVIQGETPIWMLTPSLVPFSITGNDPTRYNADYSPFVNGTNPPTHFGFYIDEQDTLVIDADRTRVRLEFDDLAGGGTANPVAGSGVVEGNGVAPDSSVAFYRDTGGSFYQRLTCTNCTPFATSAIETIHAFRDSINSSILVSNGTTQIARATVAESLLGPDPFAPISSPLGSFFAYPEYFNRPALYIEGVANLQWQDGPNGNSNPFDIRQLDLGEAPQPQARIVNNTIIGTDGRASFNGGSAAIESNDTLATATQTWQGTSHNPLFYSDVGIIGNNSQSGAVSGSSGGAGPGGNGASANFSNNRFLLSFEDGVSVERQTQVLAANGLEVLKRFDFIKTLLVGVAPTENGQLLAKIGQVQALPEVRTAEPDYIYELSRIPNDSQFPQQWHLDNRGQTGGTVDADIDAPEAWDSFTGSSQTVIAVIDSGVDYNHPDLRANMWVNPGEIAGDGVDNDRNGYIDDIHGIDTVNNDGNPMDDDGHGTHVAGTTAAVGNNGIGVTGVSWNSKIMALKGLGPQGGSTAGIIEAVNYMVTMKTRYGINIVVSNNSYGGGGFSQAFLNAIQASINVGIPFVASAGNSGTNNDLAPHYPDGYNLDGIISVSATDNNDRLAGFSQFGNTTVDLAAPGVDVLSTTLGGGYGLNSGTSMASPHVAGAVALLAGAVPGSSVSKLKAAILLGADPIPQLDKTSVTGARLNLAKSLFVLQAGLDSSVGNTDVDIYQFKLGVGERAIVDIDSAASGLDSVLQIFDSRGVPQEFSNAIGVKKFASDNDAAPGEPTSLDSYADFTATSPGVYYAAVSSVGNTSYDPVSSANRRPAATTGAYRITVSARHLQDFVITAQDASAYSDGDTFTIFGVPDIDGTGSSGRTFEFKFGAFSQPRQGNIPIHLNVGWRFPDVAQAITRAINEGLSGGAAISNAQQLPNGDFGFASPLPAVHARALGGIGAIIDAPFRGLEGDKDILLNQLEAVGPNGKNKVSNLEIQQQIRGPFTEVNQGLELFTRRLDGVITTTTTTLGGIGTFTNITSLGNLGIGHDRESTNPISYTSLADGTSEKFILVKNAAWIDGNQQIIVDPDVNESNNLDQLLPETGVLATRGASPTVLNNVFFNLQTPVINQESRVNQNTLIAAPYGTTNPNVVTKPGAVVLGGSVYQYYEKASNSARFGTGVETSPTNIPNTAADQNLDVGNSVRLFVNAQAGQYLPAPGSPIIDSSIDTLAERSSLASVRNAMGLPNYPILAPDYDLVGQLRADDPDVSPPGGLGQNVFKDRGAFDRADFVGPAAILLDPLDNDALGVDQDSSVSVVQLTGGVYPEFRIQLKDGNESTNPLKGIGIDDNSVTNSPIDNLRVTGASVVLFEDGKVLTEGIDYRFSYNATRDEIILTPLAGVWKNGRVYEFTINNKDRFVISAPSGEQITDGDSFTVTDANGGVVSFEFDSGYRLQLPQGLTIGVPSAGAGAGGIVDGDRFSINDGIRTVTFELDRNSNSLPGNIPIAFTANSTQQSIAQSINDAIRALRVAGSLDVEPRLAGPGIVFIGSKSGTKINTTFSRLEQAKSTLGLQVPSLSSVRDGQTFSVSDGLATVIFELDNDNVVGQGNTRVDFANASVNGIAIAIEAAIASSILQLSPRLIGNDTVHLGLSTSGSVSTLTSNLAVVGVSRSVSDGQTISIQFGSTTKVFEFDDNNSIAVGNIAIPLLLTDTQETLGERTAGIIKAAGLDLDPVHVRDGNISVGGTTQHTISVQNAPSIGLFGLPSVSSSTTIDIAGSLVLQVPSRGGIDVADDRTFAITANNRTVVFEFDRNFSGPSAAGYVVVAYTAASTANEIVNSMVAAINGAGLNINSRALGNGLIDLGLLADSQVDVRFSGLSKQRGNVADGEFFSIRVGGTSATFEYVNVSLNGAAAAGRIPILFTNASTRSDVITAMKVAIEAAGLGLTTTVLGASSLRLQDTPRFFYDFSAAPSLNISGVAGGAKPVQFVQDVSFTPEQVAKSIVSAVNAAVDTPLRAKIRGGNTVFVENATSISPEIQNFFLRAVEDLAGNDLKPNRVNNETEFTILMPGVALDFGDAPDPVTTIPGRYPTLFAFDGARHVAYPDGLKLRPAQSSIPSPVSTEVDGKPTPRADGDSGDDGVTFQFQGLAKPIFNRNVDTTVTVTLSQPGFVDGWIDFNGDGDWTDPGENIINSVEFVTGALTRQFQVRLPSTAPIPAEGVNSFARFRASSAGQSLPTGLALDGEVEDYLVRIVPGVPPTGVSDSYVMNEDQVGGLVTTDPTGLLTPSFKVDDGVLANDTSGDGRPLLARLITPPQHSLSGSFTFNPDGTFDYQPTLNYFGIDTFVYASYINLDVNEGELIESLAFTTVTINISPRNDVPTANNFSQQVDEDTSLTLSEQSIIFLSGALAGPANESGQTLRVSLPNFVSAQGGSLNLIGSNLVYTPKADFSGTDTFTFRLTDNGFTGALLDPLSVTRTVTVTVRAVNDAPITTPKSFTVVEDVVDASNTYPISFFTNGDSAGPTSETDPQPLGQGQTVAFSGVVIQSEKGGTVSFADGKVTYRPAADFNGTDTFYYLVTDSDSIDPKTSRGTVTVTVTPASDAPRVVSSLGQITMLEDEVERALPLASYFFDPDVIPNDDRLTYAVISNTNPSLVEPTIGPNDIFVRPKADQNGQAIIVFEASDRANQKVRNTLTVNVTPVNDAPRLAAPLPNLNVLEDSTIAETVLSPAFFFDPDVIPNGDVLTFSVTNSNTDIVTATIVNGRLRLVLVPDASGLAIITVKVVDSTGRTLEDSFDLVVAPVNDAPRVVNDTYTTPQGIELRTTDVRGLLTTSKNDDGVLANDADIEGNAFTARIRTAPTRGTVSLNADGTFSYIPSSTTLTGAVDTFTYEAVDSLGAVSSSATVSISITNPPPPRHQNPIQKLDVDADGFISPIDVLLIVNFINSNGPSTSVASLPSPPPYRDVNGNNVIEPLDVLEVINFINARGNSGAGEGELVGVMDVMPNLSAPLTWSSDVMRNSPNIATTMVAATNFGRLADAAKPFGADSRPVPASLGEYLASFGTDDEDVERLALATSDSPASTEHESLDSFFAEVFGG